MNIHSNWYSKLVGGFNLSSNRIISPNRVKIKHIGNRQPEKLSPKNLQAPLPMNFAAATLNPPVNSQHRCIGSQHENQEVSTFKICFKKKNIQTKTKQDVCTNKNHLFMFMFFAYGWFSMQKKYPSHIISSPQRNNYQAPMKSGKKKNRQANRPYFYPPVFNGCKTAAGNWELRAWNRDDALLVEDKFDHLKAPNKVVNRRSCKQVVGGGTMHKFVGSFFQQNIKII